MRLIPLLVLALVTPPAAQIGSPKFQPTPANTVGWRGDGSGRYPGATPPTAWARQKSGNGYAVQGILYAAPLPNGGVSCPVIVGPRIFVTCEPYDVVCLEKASGRVLWIRSNPAAEGAGVADEALKGLIAELAKANDDAVGELNARLGAAATSGWKNPGSALTKKREIEKKITERQHAIDKKKFEVNWAQLVFGAAGPTPVSDGKKVYAFFTNGVSAAYDLDGVRKWTAHGAGMGSEHGNFASPILAAGRFVVWANEMRAYDAESGKLAWTAPAKSFNTYGSCFKLMSGGEWVAGFQSGWFVRVRDGAPIWGGQAFGDAVSTPIVEGGLIFGRMGYPINGDETKGFRAFKIPPTTEGGKPSSVTTFKMDWAEDELVIDKKKNPFDRGFVASPLLVDGLIYNLTEGGGLLVNDAASGELVYRKVLEMKPKTEYWGWAGASASPTLAGKNIYLFDNQGTAIVLQPGPKYKELARNVLEESRDGKSQEQMVSTPIFEGSRMYYRTPNHLYCIGN